MSGTLNLVDRLLTLGRHLQQLHCHREALTVLGRLAALRQLPPDVAEETQIRLAEIHLQRRRHKRARRHLSIALCYQPDSARYHFLMGSVLDRKNGSLERAAAHYRKSLQLDPVQPECLAALGLVLLRRGLVVDGLERLQQAAEQAPNDPAVIAKQVKGLYLAERLDEALQVLRAARFRNPRDARFARLYNDFMFRRLRRRQRVERREFPAVEGPIVLPFLHRQTPTVADSGEEKVIRIDSPHTSGGPHRPHRPLRRSDWKHG
jgi:tetratricopeptide (TPR) repeat protein